MVFALTDEITFPDPHYGDPDGLLAVGGDLSTDRLILAYSNGIFPWYTFQEGMIQWWCPLERFVIFPDEIHISHSMRTLINKGKYDVTINQAFDERIIPINPLRGIEGFKAAEVKRDYLTLEEVRLLAATPCRYPILKRAFLFSCLTGLRKSDIQKLTWSEVQKFGEYTRIVFKQKKTGGQEYLDITPQAEKYLGERGNPDDFVFVGFTYGSWTSLELQRWSLTAGLKKNLTFHCGRHSVFSFSLKFKHLQNISA